MNKKGQALVEFIIILPVIIMILLAVFDYVKIFNTKIDLENTLDALVIDEKYKLDDTIKYEKEVNDDKTTYVIGKSINITSPFLVPLLDNNYLVQVKRVVYE